MDIVQQIFVKYQSRQDKDSIVSKIKKIQRHKVHRYLIELHDSSDKLTVIIAARNLEDLMKRRKRLDKNFEIEQNNYNFCNLFLCKLCIQRMFLSKFYVVFTHRIG